MGRSDLVVLAGLRYAGVIRRACAALPTVTLLDRGVRTRGRRNGFLIDVVLHQSKELVVERGILDGLATHGTEHFGRSRWHCQRCGADAEARSLLHLLQLTELPGGRGEHDAGAITIVSATGLQSRRDIQLR